MAKRPEKAKKHKKTFVFSEGGISGDQNTDNFIFS